MQFHILIASDNNVPIFKINQCSKTFQQTQLFQATFGFGVTSKPVSSPSSCSVGSAWKNAPGMERFPGTSTAWWGLFFCRPFSSLCPPSFSCPSQNTSTWSFWESEERHSHSIENHHPGKILIWSWSGWSIMGFLLDSDLTLLVQMNITLPQNKTLVRHTHTYEKCPSSLYHHLIQKFKQLI